MDAAISRNEGPLFRTANQNPEPTFHTRGQPETKAPKRPGATKLPTKLTWFACQAVRLSLDGKQIELRSFPFFALSLEHARSEILSLNKTNEPCPYTDIFQYAALHQESGKHPKMKLEATKINIETGRRS